MLHCQIVKLCQIVDKKIVCVNLLKKGRKIKLNIKKIIVLLLIVLILIPGFVYFMYVDESTSEPIKNNGNDNGNDTEEKPGFEAVFAIAGLLAIAYLVLRQRE